MKSYSHYFIFSLLFIFCANPCMSQGRYSLYQEGGYLGLEETEMHKKITPAIYEYLESLTIYSFQPQQLGSFSYHTSASSPNNDKFWKILKDGKYGVINSQGKVIIPAVYEKISNISNGYMTVRKNKKEGIIDTSGNVIIPPIHGEIIYPSDPDQPWIFKRETGERVVLTDSIGKELAILPLGIELKKICKGNVVIISDKDSHLYGACDLYGHEIIPMIYENLDFAFGCFSFKATKEVGLLNRSGERLFSFTGYNLSYIHEGICSIEVDAHSYQLTDNKGKYISSDTFSNIYTYDRFLAAFKKNNESTLFRYDKSVMPVEYAFLGMWHGLMVGWKEGKYGMATESGEVVLPFQYDNITGLSEYDYFFVQQEGKYGVMDKHFQLLLPCKYETLKSVYYMDEIGAPEYVRIVSKEKESTGVIDLKGNVHVPYHKNTLKEYESIWIDSPYFKRSKYTDSKTPKITNYVLMDVSMNVLLPAVRHVEVYYKYFVTATVNDKYGLIAADGTVLIPFIYDKLEPFGTSYFSAKKGTYVGILDRSGKIIIPFQFRGFQTFSDDYILAVDTLKKCGLIDYSAHVQIPFKYKELKYITDSLLIAYTDTSCGLIDTDEKIYIPFMYKGIYKVANNVFRVWENGHGLVTGNNTVIIPMNEEYKLLHYFNKDVIWVRGDTKQGVLNDRNQFVIPFEYREVASYNFESWFSDQGYFIRDKGKEGYFDRYGKVILPVEFKDMLLFDPVFAVCKDSIWYLADSSVIHYEKPYQKISKIGYDLLLIKKNGFYGIANQQGEVLQEPIYDKIDKMYGDAMVVWKGKKAGLINQRGEIIFDCVYDEIYNWNGYYRIVRKGNKYGLVDVLGRVKIDFIYDKLGWNSSLLTATRGARVGLIDYNGKIIRPFEHPEKKPKKNN